MLTSEQVRGLSDEELRAQINTMITERNLRSEAKNSKVMTDVFPGDRVTFHYKGTIVRGVVKKKMVKNVKVTADDGKDWKVTARLLTKEAKKKEDIRICAISAY